MVFPCPLRGEESLVSQQTVLSVSPIMPRAPRGQRPLLTHLWTLQTLHKAGFVGKILVLLWKDLQPWMWAPLGASLTPQNTRLIMPDSNASPSPGSLRDFLHPKRRHSTCNHGRKPGVDAMNRTLPVAFSLLPPWDSHYYWHCRDVESPL